MGKRLSLTNTKLLHKHNDIDKQLFHSCLILDVKGVKMAISEGANVNALSEFGE